MKKIKKICLSPFLLLLLSTLAHGETHWTNTKWKCCRIVEVVEQPDKENPIAEFSFADGGYLKKDAGDLMILDKKKKKIPFRIIWCEPGRETTIVFPSASKGKRYYIYYGNPYIMGTTYYSWKPKVSLTLETMENYGGSPWDIEEMKNLIKKNKKSYGRGFVDKIWHGLNPYGPDDNYISIYKGYLRIEREGVYRIATASDDASFLLIDGKLVAQWPGDHGVYKGLRGEHSGTLKLTRGLHRISYYHQEGKHDQFMIAAWVRPGMSKLEIIPSSSYLHPARTKEVSYRRLNKNLAACFRTKQKNEIIKEKIQYTMIDFTNCSYDVKGRKTYYNWNFGDGVKSSLKSPSHIYTGVKNYPVTLTLRTQKEKDSFKFLVRIRKPIRNLTVSDKRCLNEYAQIIDTYPHRELTRNQLLSYINLFENIDEKKYLISICSAYLERYKQHDSKSSNRIRWLLAEAYEKSCPEKAVTAYTGIAREEKNKDLVFKAMKARADLYLHKIKDYSRAMKAYKSLIKRFPTYEDRVKLARVRIGDIYVEMGEYEKAREAYAGIEKETVKDLSPEKIIMRRGIYARRVEAYLKQGALDAALNELIEWEINFPMSKLSGELTLLYSEYFFRKGDYERVISELTNLLKLNQETPFASEAKELIAKAKNRMKRQ